MERAEGEEEVEEEEDSALPKRARNEDSVKAEQERVRVCVWVCVGAGDDEGNGVLVGGVCVGVRRRLGRGGCILVKPLSPPRRSLRCLRAFFSTARFVRSHSHAHTQQRLDHIHPLARAQTNTRMPKQRQTFEPVFHSLTLNIYSSFLV